MLITMDHSPPSSSFFWCAVVCVFLRFLILKEDQKILTLEMDPPPDKHLNVGLAELIKISSMHD